MIIEENALIFRKYKDNLGSQFAMYTEEEEAAVTVGKSAGKCTEILTLFLQLLSLE